MGYFGKVFGQTHAYYAFCMHSLLNLNTFLFLSDAYIHNLKMIFSNTNKDSRIGNYLVLIEQRKSSPYQNSSCHLNFTSSAKFERTDNLEMSKMLIDTRGIILLTTSLIH